MLRTSPGVCTRALAASVPASAALISSARIGSTAPGALLDDNRYAILSSSCAHIHIGLVGT
jgi:hypothetical protein